MPAPNERSKKRKFRKTPGGRNVRHSIRGKSSKLACGSCGNNLHGVPHAKTSAKVKKLSKSKRRPSGAFGGVLCGNCRERIVIKAAKVKNEGKKITDIGIGDKKYVEQAMKVVE